MFDHSIALLEGKMRIFKLIAGTAHSKTERDGAGKHLDNMTHAIAVLKLDVRKQLVAIYGLIEALPEKS
jgi:hypothetical protein